MSVAAPATAPAVADGAKPDPQAAAAPSADAVKPSGQQTIAGGQDGGKGQPQATWPDDWRTHFAGEDKDSLTQLERYASPKDVWSKVKNLEKKLNEKAAPAKPPDDAEALKAWRAERGIPDTPEGYVDALKLPDGKVLGEADKPVAAEVAKVLHGKNVSPDVYADLVNWYFSSAERAATEQDEQDASYHDQSLVSLKEEWGGDFARNQNAIASLFPSDDIRDRLLAGRTADGKIIGDDPEMVKFLANLALDLNPAATVVNIGGPGGGKGIDDRIADIKKMMGDRNSDYWKGPKAQSIQQEYRDLLTARDKIKARGGKAA